jgi:tetratricopeptide (TPR) repeat protein
MEITHSKSTRSPGSGLVIMLISVAASTVAFSQGAPETPTIREVERLVVASPPPNLSWDPATVGRKLQMREIIEAKSLSRAVVSLSSSRVLRVNSNSRLKIVPAILQGASPGIDLQKGEIYLHSRDPGREMEVTTPAGSGKPHGTQFRVRVEDDGTATFTMFEGTMDLSNDLGNLTLGSNEEGIIEPGKAPRRTARIDAKNTIQWCLYYPGVIDLNDLDWPRNGGGALVDAVASYRAGDLLGALIACPVGYQPKSEHERVFHAMILLSVGQVKDASSQLAQVRADAPGRRAIEEMIDAVNFIERPVLPEPRTASEWLARSYYEQSRGHLEQALAAARKSSNLAPGFGFAAVKVAELEFSFGHTKAAMTALSRGLELTPRNAQAYSLQGFMLSDWNCMEAARASFESAIELDSALGTAWLGRGLCDIRRGKGEEGRRDLQTATILEPNRSLFHSYLGKAASQLGNNKAALEDLEFAKKLDPADPTPWLYSALVLQEQYKPNQAIGELQQSIDRNDNRRLYRSTLLLDQDRAVRSANLAKIYQYNGMREVAVREATRAVENDYSNASAHLFLANSFDALRDPDRILLRYETPWFNELLISNLLSPVGGGPLSQFVSQEEYSKLLTADGTGGSITTEYRSTSEISTIASLFGTHGKFSYGIDAYWRNDPGDRRTPDNDLQEIYGQLKWQPSPDDIFYFLGKWSSQTIGSSSAAASEIFEENQKPGLLLAGWNHRWAPGSNTLFLGGKLGFEQFQKNPNSTQTLVKRGTDGMQPDFIDPITGKFTNPALDNSITPDPDGQSVDYSAKLLREISPYIGSGTVGQIYPNVPFDSNTRRQVDVYSAEIQHIEQWDRNTLILGGRWQQGRIETDETLIPLTRDFGAFPNPASQPHVELDFRRTGLYIYDYWNLLPTLTLIGGAAWDTINHPDNFRNPPVNDLQKYDEDLSAKFGFTWQPWRWVTVRGLAAGGMGGLSFDESVRLEPSQLAGFNQAFRTVLSESLEGSVEAPVYQIFGLSFEGDIASRTWWGASIGVIDQEVERTRGVFTGYTLPGPPTQPIVYFADGNRENLDYREASLSLSLNRLLGDEFSVGAGYLMTRSELDISNPELKSFALADNNSSNRANLQQLSLYAEWNSPSGVFAHADVSGYDQDVKGSPPINFEGSGDEFVQLNAWAGYRFNRNLCELTAGVLNLGDTDYQLSPLNPYSNIPRERTYFVACRLSF